MLLFTPPSIIPSRIPATSWATRRACAKTAASIRTDPCGWRWRGRGWATATRAVRLLKLMNPVESSRTPEAADHFKGEPYVSPADVSFAAGRDGRAGWTWYTGSAGWMYRIWIEEVLGFQLRGDTLTISPAIPDDWDDFEITYRHRSSVYVIAVKRMLRRRTRWSPAHRFIWWTTEERIT